MMPRAHWYETPDERGDHVLYTHSMTSLRHIDPFAIVPSEKATEFAYGDMATFVGPLAVVGQLLSKAGESVDWPAVSWRDYNHRREFRLDVCEAMAALDPKHKCDCRKLPL